MIGGGRCADDPPLEVDRERIGTSDGGAAAPREPIDFAYDGASRRCTVTSSRRHARICSRCLASLFGQMRHAWCARSMGASPKASHTRRRDSMPSSALVACSLVSDVDGRSFHAAFISARSTARWSQLAALGSSCSPTLSIVLTSRAPSTRAHVTAHPVVSNGGSCPETKRTTSSVVGMPLTAPLACVERVPAPCAHTRDSAALLPRNCAATNAPMNASAAPIMSTVWPLFWRGTTIVWPVGLTSPRAASHPPPRSCSKWPLEKVITTVRSKGN